MLADRRNKVTDVAKASGISAASLGRWIAAGAMTTGTPVVTN
jgi:DNA-binding Xre family transcriptional regulator